MHGHWYAAKADLMRTKLALASWRIDMDPSDITGIIIASNCVELPSAEHMDPLNEKFHGWLL